MTNDEIKAALDTEYANLATAALLKKQAIRSISYLEQSCKHTDIIPQGFTANGRIRIGQCRTCGKPIETEV
jgi:hypothetical protein